MSVDQIRLQFESFQSFLETCSPRVSEEGIFLETEELSPVGSEVEFDLGLGSDFPILRGRGEVVWVAGHDSGDRAPGMALRFVSTDDATATLVRKIAERQRQRDAPVFGLEAASAESIPEVAATIEIETLDSPEAGAHVEETSVLSDPLGSVEADVQEIGEQAEQQVEEAAPLVEEGGDVLSVELEERVLAEAEGAGGREGRGTLWAVLALIAAIAAAGLWQRDWITERLGLGSEGLAESASADSRAESEPVETTPAVPEGDAAEAGSGEQAAEMVEAEAAPAPAAPEPSGPLTRIEDVRWEIREGSTFFVLQGDGLIPPDAFKIERLEDPPRVLLRIPGVTAPLPTPTRAVGSEEVVGIRTGLHQVADGSALHVVVDLASPTAQVTSAEADGSRLQLEVSSTAIAP